MELFNTIVGVLALVISVVALIHSIYYNMVKIKLSDCEIHRVDKGYDWLYEFSVSNLSNVSVIITKIELYSKEGKLINDNGFDPFKKHYSQRRPISGGPFSVPLYEVYTPLSSSWESSPFNSETEVYPASRESFSYYLDEEPVKIKVTTNKRIHKFRKHQLFFPHFNNNR